MAKAKTTNQIDEVGSQALVVATKLSSIVITNQQTYNMAVHSRQSAKEFIDKVDQIFEPMRQKAHEAYKQVLATRDAAKAPAISALADLERGIKGYLRSEQERLEQERAVEEERLRELAEKQRQRDIKRLRKQGYDEDSVQAMADVPVEITAVATQKIDTGGISTRDTWSGRVVDLFKLVQFVAKNKHFIHLLMANNAEVNKIARSQRDQLSIPGLQAEKDFQIASRRR